MNIFSERDESLLDAKKHIKALEEANEEHRKLNGRLRNEIKQLEEELEVTKYDFKQCLKEIKNIIERYDSDYEG